MGDTTPIDMGPAGETAEFDEAATAELMAGELDAPPRGDRRPRWAGSIDAAGLRDLLALGPAVQDPFELVRPHGPAARFAVLDGPRRGELAACVAVVPRAAVFVGGKPRKVLAVWRPRLAPGTDGAQLRDLVAFAATSGLVQGIDLGFTVLPAGSLEAEALLGGDRTAGRLWRVATLCDWRIDGRRGRRPDRGLVVRLAVSGDLPNLVAFWNAQQADRPFAPMADEGFFEGASPAPQDHLLAFRGGDLVGLLAVGRPIARAPNGPPAASRGLAHPWLARLFRGGRPSHGDAPLDLVRVVAATPADLRGLLSAAVVRFRADMRLVLDATDPLAAALEGLATPDGSSELAVLDPLGRWGGLSLGGQPSRPDLTLA